MSALLLAVVYLVVLAFNVDAPTFFLLLFLGIAVIFANDADRDHRAWMEELTRRIERRKRNEPPQL